MKDDRMFVVDGRIVTEEQDNRIFIVAVVGMVTFLGIVLTTALGLLIPEALPCTPCAASEPLLSRIYTISDILMAVFVGLAIIVIVSVVIKSSLRK